MAEKRIPWRSQEFVPEMVSGLIPDGMNEFLHPDYPDLPYPDGIHDVTWYRDPLVNNDEPSPHPDDRPAREVDAWLFPYDPYYPPTA